MIKTTIENTQPGEFFWLHEGNSELVQCIKLIPAYYTENRFLYAQKENVCIQSLDCSTEVYVSI